MGKAISELDSYAGPMSGTTKLPVSDGDTLKTATASQVKTYIEGEIGTAQFRALLDDADAAAQRATLGLGNAATKNTGTTTGTVAAGDDARLSDARTPTSHTHALADMAQSSATTGQVPTWNGTAWVPATPSGGGVTAGFAIAMSLVFGG